MDKLDLAALVREIGTLAPQVAEEHREQHKAFTENCNAQAQLLEQVIALAKPALRAVSNAIPLRDERGLVLVDGWLPNLDPGDWGRYTEKPRVYLLSDAKLMSATRELDAADKPMVAFLELSEHEVVIEHDLPDIVETINVALKRQVGKRVNSTGRARSDTTKLEAILVLLGVEPGKNPAF